MNPITVRSTLLLSCLLVWTVCGDAAGPTPATMEVVAGSYVVAVFETTTDGATTDQLGAGSSLTLNLSPIGTTSGRLFVPGGAEDGGDFEADLTGTWSLSDNEVRLDHPADTFLRDMILDYDNGVLSGSATFGDTQVTVELHQVVEGEWNQAP